VGERGGFSLFSREGGSPVWVPAFAGKHGVERDVRCNLLPSLVKGEAGGGWAVWLAAVPAEHSLTPS
jgi:hypothetical protein